MTKFNKVNVSVLAGAVMTAAATLFPGFVSAEVAAAVQTLIVSMFVFMVPNA